MHNQQVARLLYHIADLLDIKGESFFKIRAYRMAAQKIEVLNEDIKSYVEKNQVTQIEGIGEAIAKKITEYVTTGTLKYYENLITETPESLLDLLNIQGVGPRKVAQLFNELNISTIARLKQACLDGKLRDLEGFGEITERNILRGITLQDKTSGRVLLHIAYTDGMEYLSFLRYCSKIQQLSLAGSLRRMKETIGDIDILASSTHPESVMDYFIEFDRVAQILLKGLTKTSVLLDDNLQVDLRVVKPQSYGSALQYFTGSKEHNVKMRSIAITQGYKLNEYGLSKKDTDTIIAGDTEEAIYEHLGLEFIPPELRENRDEIDYARQHNLPKLVNLKDIKGDLHIHSEWSDGHDSIQTIAEHAQKMGYKYLGITDHSQSLSIAHGLSPSRIEKKIEHIQKLNKKFDQLHILCGTECDIKPNGTLDYPPQILKKMDFVYIGIHTGFSMNADSMTSRIINGMKHKYVDFLAHPTGRLIGRRAPFNLDFEKIINAAKENHIGLEINAFPDRLDINDIHIQQAKNEHVKMIIGTDSHTVDHLNFMNYGVATARRGWCTKLDIINTQSFTKLSILLETNR